LLDDLDGTLLGIRGCGRDEEGSSDHRLRNAGHPRRRQMKLIALSSFGQAEDRRRPGSQD
jgi:hypothetical protein